MSNAEIDLVSDQQQGYSIFVPQIEDQELELISSTGDRYNESIKNSLQKDLDIIQQKVSLDAQSNSNNFYHNAKWSPDGSCLLSSSADNVVRLFQLPVNVYADSPEANNVIDMTPTMGIREGESVYDFCWFPSMNMADPSTCCFLTSVRDHPIQLWDIATGTVRASYSAIDHCERFIGPNSLTFNLDGSKIYCGYENVIEIFDVQTSNSSKHPTIPKRKSRKGQKGIMSSIDFCPDYTGLYAVGSYSQSIGLYDESNNELCFKLTGFVGGVTQVKFSKDGKYLFSASRHSNSILCWDIRDSANVLYELPRPGKTNQRISFDIDAAGKYLTTGDQFGHLLVYDISTGEAENIETKQRLVKSVKASQDIISCATWNPVYPVMATCSGQRKFPLYDNDSDDSDMEEDEDCVIDNRLQCYRVPGQYEWFSYPTVPTVAVEETVLITEEETVVTTITTIEETTAMEEVQA